LNELAVLVQSVPVSSIQLYPDWTVEEIAELKKTAGRPFRILKFMSALPAENFTSDDAIFLKRYENCVDAILLDSHRCGGTGELADLD